MAAADPGRAPAPGAGRTVLFLHGSLGAGRMWRAYAEDLAGRAEAVAPDLVGYAATPAWPDGAPFRFSDEFIGIEAALAASRGPVEIVAHSYGAAVALAYAMARPGRVKSLMLIEPTVFGVLRVLGPTARCFLGEIMWVARMVEEHVSLGQPEAAMRGFVDYWNGRGAWAGLDDARRTLFTEKAATVARNFEAGFGWDVGLGDLARLSVPTLIVTGRASPRAAVATARAVLGVLPRADCLSVAGAGHMLPVTHAETCRRIVADWLATGRATPMERAA